MIGTDVTYAPFEFADKHNQYVGIDIDLMQAIAKAEGFRVDIKPLGFNAAVQALEAHQIDGVIAGMQITPERKQKFAMSDPYYKTAVAMAVAKNSGVNQLKDLRGKRVALKTGTAAADFAMSLKSKYGFSTVTFDDSNNMYQDVITGNSVACFDDKPVLQYAIATGLKLKLAGPESKASYYGFATQKGRSDELDQKFNAGLKKVKADGTYAKIVAKYLGNGTQAAQKQTSAKTQDTDRSFLGLLRENWGTLMNGLRETMVVTIVAIFFATAVGILVGLLGVLPNRFARGVATTFIYIFRGLPLLVLALFIYTGVPSLIGSKIPAFVAGIITLTLNERIDRMTIVVKAQCVLIGQDEKGNSGSGCRPNGSSPQLRLTIWKSDAEGHPATRDQDYDSEFHQSIHYYAQGYFDSVYYWYSGIDANREDYHCPQHGRVQDLDHGCADLSDYHHRADMA